MGSQSGGALRPHAAGGGDGHWGALAVDPVAQGKGVGSALVAAAEKRLLDAGCRTVQIEYRFVVGDERKERLYAWYEGKLGFSGGPRRSGFRVCHKTLSAETLQAQHPKSALFAQPEQSMKRARTRSSSRSTTSPSPSSSSESRSPSQQLRSLDSSPSDAS